jgi:poly-gamma-glutamate synthesis protein (capsule biosynthesis protein)
LLAVSGCRTSQATPQHTTRKTQHATRNTQDATTVTLAAVGDILLDRDVGKKIDEFGIDYPFQKVADVLSSADIAFGNLECPLSEKGAKVIKPFVFQAKPRNVQCLVKAGLDVVSLANNHTMDCGRTGLVETMETLRQNGVRWCGAGRHREDAEAATVLQVKGIKVAFVGFCDFIPEGAFLRDDKPTMAMASEENIRKSVAAAHKKADVVIASFHWGVEFDSRPSERQIKFAHAAAESGGDLVLGHHPHVLQGIEVKQFHASRIMHHSLIAYSLGNFVFDQRRYGAMTSNTAILRCTLNKRGVVSAEVVPVKIEKCRPRPATEEEAKTILTRLTTLCGELETRMEEGQVVIRDR